MPNEFVNPNLHVTLIHFPLALLLVGVLIEIFAFLGWRRSTFRAAGRWMILLGALALVPVTFSGLYAMADVNRLADAPIGGDLTPWIDVRAASPISAAAWDYMTTHAWSSAIGSAVILLAVVLWMGSSDLWRRRLHLFHLLLIVGGLGAILYGAWFGGEMVYRHAVGVEPPQGEASDVSTEEEPEPGPEFFAPPLQVHVILAGATVSLGLAALGLSLRAGAQAKVFVEPPPEYANFGTALNPNARPEGPTISRAELGTLDEEARRSVVERPIPGRFWLLAALVGLLTTATGAWTLAQFADTWNVNDLAPMVTDRETYGSRRLAHVVTGGAIIVLLLVLAVAARFAAARRFIITLLAFLLLAAIAAQIWFGSLLLFDSSVGPLGSFQVSENAEAMTEEAQESPAPEPSAGEESTTAPAAESATPPPATAPAPAPAPATTTTTTAPVATTAGSFAL